MFFGELYCSNIVLKINLNMRVFHIKIFFSLSILLFMISSCSCLDSQICDNIVEKDNCLRTCMCG
jgi:hypothetical protein